MAIVWVPWVLFKLLSTAEYVFEMIFFSLNETKQDYLTWICECCLSMLALIFWD